MVQGETEMETELTSN